MSSEQSQESSICDIIYVVKLSQKSEDVETDPDTPDIYILCIAVRVKRK